MRDRELIARRHPDHLFDQIDTGDEFRHRVLDLKPGVHLEKVEILVAVDDELDGPGAGIADGFRKCAGLFAHGFAGCLVKKRAWRLFDDFLISALDRTLPLAKIDAIAMSVGQHLDFDVPRLRHEFLDEDPVVAERGCSLILRRLKALARLLVVPRDPHPLAATTGGGFDHHRIADLGRDFRGLVGVFDQSHDAGNRRDTGILRNLLRGDLVAHRLDRPNGWTDESHTGLVERFGEFGIFREKPVARVHSLRAAFANGRHHVVDHDVGLIGRRRPDVNGLVRHPDVQRMFIGVGIDRHGLDTHASRRLDNAAGDFAPICDQDLVKHGCPS